MSGTMNALQRLKKLRTEIKEREQQRQEQEQLRQKEEERERQEQRKPETSAEDGSKPATLTTDALSTTRARLVQNLKQVGISVNLVSNLGDRSYATKLLSKELKCPGQSWDDCIKAWKEKTTDEIRRKLELEHEKEQQREQRREQRQEQQREQRREQADVQAELGNVDDDITDMNEEALQRTLKQIRSRLDKLASKRDSTYYMKKLKSDVLDEIENDHIKGHNEKIEEIYSEFLTSKDMQDLNDKERFTKLYEGPVKEMRAMLEKKKLIYTDFYESYISEIPSYKLSSSQADKFDRKTKSKVVFELSKRSSAFLETLFPDDVFEFSISEQKIELECTLQSLKDATQRFDEAKILASKDVRDDCSTKHSDVANELQYMWMEEDDTSRLKIFLTEPQAYASVSTPEEIELIVDGNQAKPILPKSVTQKQCEFRFEVSDTLDDGSFVCTKPSHYPSRLFSYMRFLRIDTEAEATRDGSVAAGGPDNLQVKASLAKQAADAASRIRSNRKKTNGDSDKKEPSTAPTRQQTNLPIVVITKQDEEGTDFTLVVPQIEKKLTIQTGQTIVLTAPCLEVDVQPRFTMNSRESIKLQEYTLEQGDNKGRIVVNNIESSSQRYKFRWVEESFELDVSKPITLRDKSDTEITINPESAKYATDRAFDANFGTLLIQKRDDIDDVRFQFQPCPQNDILAPSNYIRAGGVEAATKICLQTGCNDDDDTLRIGSYCSSDALAIVKDRSKQYEISANEDMCPSAVIMYDSEQKLWSSVSEIPFLNEDEKVDVWIRERQEEFVFVAKQKAGAVLLLNSTELAPYKFVDCYDAFEGQFDKILAYSPMTDGGWISQLKNSKTSALLEVTIEKKDAACINTDLHRAYMNLLEFSKRDFKEERDHIFTQVDAWTGRILVARYEKLPQQFEEAYLNSIFREDGLALTEQYFNWILNLGDTCQSYEENADKLDDYFIADKIEGKKEQWIIQKSCDATIENYNDIVGGNKSEKETEEEAEKETKQQDETSSKQVVDEENEGSDLELVILSGGGGDADVPETPETVLLLLSPSNATLNSNMLAANVLEHQIYVLKFGDNTFVKCTRRPNTRVNESTFFQFTVESERLKGIKSSEVEIYSGVTQLSDIEGEQTWEYNYDWQGKHGKYRMTDPGNLEKINKAFSKQYTTVDEANRRKKVDQWKATTENLENVNDAFGKKYETVKEANQYKGLWVAKSAIDLYRYDATTSDPPTKLDGVKMLSASVERYGYLTILDPVVIFYLFATYGYPEPQPTAVEQVKYDSIPFNKFYENQVLNFLENNMKQSEDSESPFTLEFDDHASLPGIKVAKYGTNKLPVNIKQIAPNVYCVVGNRGQFLDGHRWESSQGTYTERVRPDENMNITLSFPARKDVNEMKIDVPKNITVGELKNRLDREIVANSKKVDALEWAKFATYVSALGEYEELESYFNVGQRIDEEWFAWLFHYLPDILSTS